MFDRLFDFLSTTQYELHVYVESVYVTVISSKLYYLYDAIGALYFTDQSA